MPILSKNTRIWLRGLIAAAITAFSTALSGALSLPSVFNLSHNGIINILKLSLVPTVLAVCAYLAKSPIPAPDSITIEKQETKVDGSQISTTATIVTSPENGQVK